MLALYNAIIGRQSTKKGIEPPSFKEINSSISHSTIFAINPSTQEGHKAFARQETKSKEQAIAFLRGSLEQWNVLENKGFIVKASLTLNYDGDTNVVQNKTQLQILLKTFEQCSPIQKLNRVVRMAFF